MGKDFVWYRQAPAGCPDSTTIEIRRISPHPFAPTPQGSPSVPRWGCSHKLHWNFKDLKGTMRA